MVAFLMTINGQGVKGIHNFEVINPATEEIITSVPECSNEQLDMAVSAATRALTGWRQDVV